MILISIICEMSIRENGSCTCYLSLLLSSQFICLLWFIFYDCKFIVIILCEMAITQSVVCHKSTICNVTFLKFEYFLLFFSFFLNSHKYVKSDSFSFKTMKNQCLKSITREILCEKEKQKEK